MKKISKLFAVALLSFSLLMLAACGDDKPKDDDDDPIIPPFSQGGVEGPIIPYE